MTFYEMEALTSGSCYETGGSIAGGLGGCLRSRSGLTQIRSEGVRRACL